MNYNEYLDACKQAAETNVYPADWPGLLISLAYDRNSYWERAHAIAQEITTPEGSAVHAYLHRKEGVQWNAEYWYQRAGRKPFAGPLESEWEALVKEFLK